MGRPGRRAARLRRRQSHPGDLRHLPDLRPLTNLSAWQRELGAQVVHTVVLASNDDGLRFARHQGFVEIDRYVLPGDTIAFVDLRLA
ncbi:hypothetical protein AB0J89_25935 [Micromonospora chokoriensis]